MNDTIFHSLVPEVRHYKNNGYMSYAHLHPCFELSFFVSGTIKIKSNTDIYTITSPSVVIFAPYNIHMSINPNREVYERYMFFYDEDYINTYITDTDVLDYFLKEPLIIQSLTEERYNILFNLFQRLYDFPNGSNPWKLVTMVILHEIYNWRCSLTHSRESSCSPYIQNVIEYLLLHYGDNISLDSIAAHFFISRSKLVSDFKNAIGLSLMRYLTLIRLNNARKLLIHNYSVAQTAEMCGYNNQSHFISQFSKYFRMTPGAFCQELRNKSQSNE